MSPCPRERPWATESPAWEGRGGGVEGQGEAEGRREGGRRILTSGFKAKGEHLSPYIHVCRLRLASLILGICE